MLKSALAAAILASALMLALEPAEARHLRRDMHGWCRADAAQMMGISRRAVRLERVEPTEGGRYAIRGLADHGRYGWRSFVCQFNQRRVLQGAV